MTTMGGGAVGHNMIDKVGGDGWRSGGDIWWKSKVFQYNVPLSYSKIVFSNPLNCKSQGQGQGMGGQG